MTTFKIAAAFALATIAGGLVASTQASAQQYAAMSCDALWYQRNSIYAQNGYCFQTARARSVFGPGCFPPFGRLSAYEQDQVNQIQYWERRRGCR